MIAINLIRAQAQALIDRRAKKAASVRKFIAENPGYSTRYVKRWREAHPEENQQARAQYRNKPKSKKIKVEGQSKRRAADPVAAADWWRQKKYGLAPGEFRQMLAEQDGLCAACRQPPTGKRAVLSVDHNHATGAIRQLLCMPCNSALGLLCEDVERFLALISYIKKHNE